MWAGLLTLPKQIAHLTSLMQEQNSLLRELIALSGKSALTKRTPPPSGSSDERPYRKRTDQDVMVVTPEVVARLRSESEHENERLNHPPSPDLSPKPQD